MTAESWRATLLGGLDHPGLTDRAWDTLSSDSETATVFQTRAWHRSWWSAYGESHEPRVIEVSRGGRLIGLAPLMVARRYPQLIRFIGDGRADYCDVIAGAADKPAVLEAVFSTLEGTVPWTAVALNNVPADSGTVSALRDFCRLAGYRLVVDQQFICPTLLIQGQGESALQIYNKPSLRRPQNVLARAGRLACRTVTTDLEVAPLLDTFFAQHIGRWAPTATPSLFLDARNREFYRSLAAELGPKGWLHFSAVEFDDQPIAFHFGFDHAGTLTWYKPSFEIGFAARSPGMIMLRHLIGHAIEQKRDELDFTVGDELFKRRFTNSVRHTVRLRVYRDPSSFLLDRSRHAVSDVVRWISRRSPITRFSGGSNR